MMTGEERREVSPYLCLCLGHFGTSPEWSHVRETLVVWLIVLVATQLRYSVLVLRHWTGPLNGNQKSGRDLLLHCNQAALATSD